jgi:hypothetical protein
LNARNPLQTALALGLTLLAAAPAAQAQAPAAPVAPVADHLATRLLAAIDVPLTADLIRQTGLSEAIATAALADAKSPRYVRLRAVSALPFFGTPTARALAERTAAEDADEVVRVQAVTSLARGFGPKDPAGVRATLRRLAAGAATAPKAVAEALPGELAAFEAAVAAQTPPGTPATTTETHGAGPR